MSGFDADWLALRAPADTRARNPEVARALAALFAGRRGGGALRVLDLGAGTGANLRVTARLLPLPQRWTLADRDEALLARAAPLAGVEIERRPADLAQGVAALLSPAPDLVTASAFFDLAGAEWIDALVDALATAGAPLHAVLSHDGREAWAGDHPDDAAVRDAFLADQRRDKGLGPALGPDAHARLSRRLAAAGFRVVEGLSDWRLAAPDDAALIAALAAGTGAAARPALGPRADRWAGSRARASGVLIGHRDLLAVPDRHQI